MGYKTSIDENAASLEGISVFDEEVSYDRIGRSYDTIEEAIRDYRYFCYTLSIAFFVKDQDNVAEEDRYMNLLTKSWPIMKRMDIVDDNGRPVEFDKSKNWSLAVIMLFYSFYKRSDINLNRQQLLIKIQELEHDNIWFASVLMQDENMDEVTLIEIVKNLNPHLASRIKITKKQDQWIHPAFKSKEDMMLFKMIVPDIKEMKYAPIPFKVAKPV